MIESSAGTTPGASFAFEALFRRLIAAAGEETALVWHAAFLETFPLRDWEKLERYRSFPLFLRNERRLGRLSLAHFVDLAMWDWAEFSALYSPADEIRDRDSLKARERILNPTAQILRLEHDLPAWFVGGSTGLPKETSQMSFVYRAWAAEQGYHLRVHSVDWSTAAIVDPLLESGRLSDERLIIEIEAHHGQGHAAAWCDRIQSLVEQQLLLEGH